MVASEEGEWRYRNSSIELSDLIIEGSLKNWAKQKIKETRTHIHTHTHTHTHTRPTITLFLFAFRIGTFACGYNANELGKLEDDKIHGVLEFYVISQM
jgi:hypothetical protein